VYSEIVFVQIKQQKHVAPIQSLRTDQGHCVPEFFNHSLYQMQLQAKRERGMKKHPRFPLGSSPPPTKPPRSRIPRPKPKRARTPLGPRRARNDYDERIPTLSKEWERTSNRDLMRRKRRRERRRRTPSARTAGSRRERKARVA
jgi:hypothetical protein